jgi:hypothetical protein
MVESRAPQKSYPLSYLWNHIHMKPLAVSKAKKRKTILIKTNCADPG